mmetsp:Transcript_50582/g.107752  ORF Transcript_50582/g.107752 Transcript_50582/m.107752 type:complete len:418 (-) Transcript_50582:159-1412(-)|eukprot:CAMPEP_0172547988 /NCGR_PEP_ID=MMETSP1067-20121228/17398_1 /TAXON_ID=265564 ORGANISM="Thalassiosira punctigera, Strain Tpunct2005C2" /NCGR_SAMPLE_ID=MMETSP1067 /ASSEMBLY_ACC=CAM_ASM_000444 /LENGTH=417 /DNA_ID=CAMNT_0013335161 /DNA_START=165 /DNA_END=1418 /DNA_ORIENTATION=-
MGGACDEERFPPLKIVLGAFNGSSTGSKTYDVEPSLSAGALEATASQSSSPATYILSTSYFATPRLGSPQEIGITRRSAMRLNKDGRVPMSDRKFYLDHFKPKTLLLSTARVTAISLSSTFSSLFSDQLHSEQRVESMVDSGEISPHEADKMNDEWEEREWRLRKDVLPKKIGWALVRFHTCTALMRFYEFVMAWYVLRVDGVGRGGFLEVGGADDASMRSPGNGTPSLTHEQGVDVMDKLTRDPFQASLRTSQLLRKQEHSPGMVISPDGTETSTSRELTRRMFTTCLWANIIPFLAELTVQQLVLIYGYGVYYAAKRRRRKEGDGVKDGEGREVSYRCEQEGGGDSKMQAEEDDAASESAYALALMFRSSRLTIARSMSWVAASAGGAVGSIVYPGWGTVFGIQIGDTVVGALTD